MDGRPLKAQTKLICIGALIMLLLVGIIVNAVFDDVEGPLVYQVDVMPTAPAAGDTISVIIYCIDPSGVSDAKLSYSINGGEWQVADMCFYFCLCIAGGRWVASFGPLQNGDTSRFFVTAFDDSPSFNSADTEIFSIIIEI